MKNIKPIIKHFFKLKYLIPFIYIAVYLVGLILYFISLKKPDLITSQPCLILAGNTVCTTLGLYLLTISSIPGYVISNSIIRTFITIPTSLTYITVVVISLIFYFLIGLILEKLFRSSEDPAKLTKLIIILSFVMFLFLFLVLKTI